MEDWKSRRKSKLRIEYRARLKTWVGRIKFSDGSRTPIVDLMSDDERVAQERYDSWFESGVAPDVGGKEPFEAAVERLCSDDEERLGRLRHHAVPRMGFVQVKDIRKHHVATVLDAMADAGLLAGTLLKVRSDISRVLSALQRRGAIEHNVARGCELGEHAERDDRPRVVLTDEELVRFRRRGFKTELDMMALIARDLGGHRTSDLHAADWSDFDTLSWRTCRVRRPKTDPRLDRRRVKERAGKRRATRAYEKVVHTIPATVVGPLTDWWQAQGRPAAGPVFPLRKGPKAGERKSGKGISYAKALRDALWAEGIVRALPGYESAVGEDRRAFCSLQVDTDESRAVDFHSFRRAFITALASAGVSLQDAMDASGHTVATTSHGYRGPRTITLPEAALPGNKQGLPLSGFSPTPAAPKPSPKKAREEAVAGVLGLLHSTVGGVIGQTSYGEDGPSRANPAKPLANKVGPNKLR